MGWNARDFPIFVQTEAMVCAAYDAASQRSVRKPLLDRILLHCPHRRADSAAATNAAFFILIDLHGYRLGRIVVLFVALLLVLAQRVDQVDPAHSARPFTSTQKKSRPPLSAKGRRVVVEMSVIKPIGTQAPRTSRRLALCRIFCAKSSPIPLANSGATRSTSSCG